MTLTTAYNRAIVVAVALMVFVIAPPAQATTITFDSPISTPNPNAPFDFLGNGQVLVYAALQPNPVSLVTQGFEIGGFTDGVTVGDTFPFPSIVDPSICPPGLCTNGKFFGFGQPNSLTTDPSGTGMALKSFMAATQPDATGANQNPSAATITVFGFRANNQVAVQTFTLGANYQLFTLDNDPDWASIDRAVFQPLSAAGGDGVALMDDIVVDAIPEPASMLLLGTGLAALAARRRGKRPS